MSHSWTFEEELPAPDLSDHDYGSCKTHKEGLPGVPASYFVYKQLSPAHGFYYAEQ